MLITIIFIALMVAVFGRLLLFAIKFTWGLFKVLLTLVFLPLIIVGAFLKGLLYIAFPVLIIVGIVSLIRGSDGVQ